MSLDLVRIDDRLIHGQVVVGWGQVLTPDLLVLADDDVAGSEWERELYCMGVPNGISVEFYSVAEAAGHVANWMDSSKKTILLVGDIDSLVGLCHAAPEIRKVNLGGLHRDQGREERLPYIFLSEDEAAKLKGLRDRGIEISAQDLPNAAEVPLGEIV